MRKPSIPIITIIIVLLSFTAKSQSFSNFDELLQLSEMDPLEVEKSVNAKGFTFTETDGLKSSYSKTREGIQYTITPRSIIYNSPDRIFFLEVNSRVIKNGFVLVNSEAVLIESGEKVKAQQYQKGKFTVWLHTAEGSSGNTNYIVQIDNSSPSSVKKAKSSETPSSGRKDYKYKGDKDKIDYGYFNVGLILPRGIIAEDPKLNTTLEQDFTGMSGIGAKPGFEFGLGGIVGITPLNKVLPYALDFGIIMEGQFGVQPYSYKSLGGNYEDYSYTGFMKAGAGAGPAIVLTPFREADFHISFYYKIDAGINFSGGFKYIGSNDYEETLERDAVSFAWIKSYGLHIYGAGVFGGLEFSNYTDKGTFNQTQSYFANNNFYLNEKQIKAALPIRQICIKIGFTF